MVVNLLKVWLLTEWLEHHQGNETAQCRAPQFEGRAEFTAFVITTEMQCSKGRSVYTYI